MATAIDELRFGRDLNLPESADDALALTVTGDVQSVAGRENLRKAVRCRAVTVQGELVHRPEYGGDLPLYVERASTPAGRAALANALRRGAFRDDRLKDVAVEVSTGTPADSTAEDAVTIAMTITARTEDVAEQITFGVQS